MLPNREGRFKASILEHGVAETGPNNLATFICKFGLMDELVNGQWLGLDPEESGLDITGYFYLEKKDGSINTVTVDQLKAAFGWDGRDPLWLQDSDFNGLVVQVKLEFELYDGKTRLKVRYVDAENADGRGVPKADDAARKSLSTRLGSKLRALAGGSPVSTPRPSGKPTAPPAPRPSTPTPTTRTAAPTTVNAVQTTRTAAPTTVNAAETTRGAAETTVAAAPTIVGTVPTTENAAQTTERAAPTTVNAAPTTGAAPQSRPAPAAPVSSMQRAWGAFLAAVPQGWSQKSVDEEWFRVLGELLPGKPAESFTPAEWALIEQEAPSKIIPM